MPSTTQRTVEVMKGKPAQVGAFGANGKSPQLASTVNAATVHAAGGTPTAAEFNAVVDLQNQLRTLLIACGLAQ